MAHSSPVAMERMDPPLKKDSALPFGLRLSSTLGQHPLFLMHLATLGYLALASYSYAGFSRQPLFVAYFLPFCCAMVVLWLIGGRGMRRLIQKIPDMGRHLPWLETGAAVVLLLYPFLFMLDFGSVPLVEVIRSNDYYGISRFRGSLTHEMPVWQNYMKAYYLRALAPFFLLYFFHVRSKWFWPVFIVSVFFALNMIAKSYIVMLLAPLILYQFGRKMWVKAGGAMLALLLMLGFLVYVTNPVLHLETEAGRGAGVELGSSSLQQEAMLLDGEPATLSSTLYEIWSVLKVRVLQTQARVIDDWARIIPNEVPYLSGCGYRLLSRFIGCEYVYLPSLIYTKVNPQLATEQHLKGALNSAHFMNDYANFGMWGIVLSACATCLVLFLLESLYVHKLVMISLNTTFILLLTEAPMTLLLHTGALC